MSEYVTTAVTKDYEVGFNTAWDSLRLTTYDFLEAGDLGDECAGSISIETWLSPEDARALAAALMDAAYRFDGYRE